MDLSRRPRVRHYLEAASNVRDEENAELCSFPEGFRGNRLESRTPIARVRIGSTRNVYRSLGNVLRQAWSKSVTITPRGTLASMSNLFDAFATMTSNKRARSFLCPAFGVSRGVPKARGAAKGKERWFGLSTLPAARARYRFPGEPLPSRAYFRPTVYRRIHGARAGTGSPSDAPSVGGGACAVGIRWSPIKGNPRWARGSAIERPRREAFRRRRKSSARKITVGPARRSGRAARYPPARYPPVRKHIRDASRVRRARIAESALDQRSPGYV